MSHHPRDLVSLCIHALLISNVVSALRLISINLTRVGTSGRSDKKSTASADYRAGAGVSRCGAEGRTDACADNRSHYGPCSSILIDCLLRCHSDLLACPLPADCIFDLELLKGLPWGWKHFHGWTRRQSHAAAHCQQCQQRHKKRESLHK